MDQSFKWWRAEERRREMMGTTPRPLSRQEASALFVTGPDDHFYDDGDATPTKAGREGDSQAMPVVNESTDIQSMVITDVEARREVGISRYGTALQANNGRDALLDAYEEAMDLTIYLKQALVERDAS